jgi:hypothetical protein
MEDLRTRRYSLHQRRVEAVNRPKFGSRMTYVDLGREVSTAIGSATVDHNCLGSV